MSDLFFRITPEHLASGEFRKDEIGWYAVRYDLGAVMVVRSRADAERVWATIAHHYGYAHN